MKRKILAQELANYLARHAECDPKVAESFARAFFDVIEQGLLQDKFVKIKGFGTFKLIAVSNRESININTGERFQISGHTKISFTPDNTMKELVNRPFAHFTSVDLNDETDIKEFDDIDQQMEELEREELEQAKAKMAEHTVVPEDLDEKNETATDEKVTNIEGETLSPNSSECKDDSHIPLEVAQSVIVPSNEDMSETPCEEKKNPSDSTSSEAEAEKASLVSEEEPVDEPEREKPVAETSDCKMPAGGFVTKNTFETQQFRYTYTEKPPRKKRNLWKTIAIVLGILLLMFVCYLAGYFRVLCPCSIPFAGKWSEQKIEIAETIPLPHEEDSVPQSPSASKSLKSSAQDSAKTLPPPPAMEKKKTESYRKATEKESKKNAGDGISKVDTQQSDTSSASSSKPSYHLVRKGDNVYKISRKYYGSDKYVPAIIKLNKLHDANNIVIGKRLRLP